MGDSNNYHWSLSKDETILLPNLSQAWYENKIQTQDTGILNED